MGNFNLEHDVFYMRKIFENDIEYANLWLVSESMRNVIFDAFHDNPIVSYHDAFHKFHKIHQRYLWPGMYQYCKRMIAACTGCSLIHHTMLRISDLVYGLHINTPMRLLFVDIYTSGLDTNFDINHNHLIAACGMTGFAISGSTLDQTVKTLASALMKICIRFGFYHTIVCENISNEFQI